MWILPGSSPCPEKAAMHCKMPASNATVTHIERVIFFPPEKRKALFDFSDINKCRNQKQHKIDAQEGIFAVPESRQIGKHGFERRKQRENHKENHKNNYLCGRFSFIAHHYIIDGLCILVTVIFARYPYRLVAVI